MQDKNGLDQQPIERWWYKMRHVATKALYQHWQDICRGNIIPDRNDLDPSQIGHLLRDVFILGVDHHGCWRYRVAGTRLTGFAGRELRDESFDTWWSGDDKRDAHRLLSAVANDALPVVIGMKARGHDENLYEVEGLILPLRHGGRSGMRMIGGFFPSSATANRLGLRIVDFKLLSLRTIDPSKPVIPMFGREPDNLELILSRRTSFRVIEGGLNN
jgi:hypothetical protein